MSVSRCNQLVEFIEHPLVFFIVTSPGTFVLNLLSSDICNALQREREVWSRLLAYVLPLTAQVAILCWVLKHKMEVHQPRGILHNVCSLLRAVRTILTSGSIPSSHDIVRVSKIERNKISISGQVVEFIEQPFIFFLVTVPGNFVFNLLSSDVSSALQEESQLWKRLVAYTLPATVQIAILCSVVQHKMEAHQPREMLDKDATPVLSHGQICQFLQYFVMNCTADEYKEIMALWRRNLSAGSTCDEDLDVIMNRALVIRDLRGINLSTARNDAVALDVDLPILSRSAGESNRQAHLLSFAPEKTVDDRTGDEHVRFVFMASKHAKETVTRKTIRRRIQRIQKGDRSKLTAAYLPKKFKPADDVCEVEAKSIDLGGNQRDNWGHLEGKQILCEEYDPIWVLRTDEGPVVDTEPKPPKLVKREPIELKVPFCCQGGDGGVEERIESRIIELKGVDLLKADSDTDKVTIAGKVKPDYALKEGMSIVKTDYRQKKDEEGRTDGGTKKVKKKFRVTSAGNVKQEDARKDARRVVKKSTVNEEDEFEFWPKNATRKKDD